MEIILNDDPSISEKVRGQALRWEARRTALKTVNIGNLDLSRSTPSCRDLL